jgi:nitrogen fixation protein NifX
MEKVMRIAFASSDGRAVNQHFGMAQRFYIWDVGPEHAREIGKVAPAKANMDHDDKLVSRTDAVDGCTIVYSVQIGGPAAAKLVGRHIQPLKARDNTPISDAISELQRVLQGNPPAWLRKAAGLATPEMEYTDEPLALEAPTE